MRDHPLNSSRQPMPQRSPAAFTLVEMLVVVGLIAGLIAVIAVVATKARGNANKFQLAAQLQAIAVALDAYKTDFGSYPVTQVDDSLRLPSGITTADNVINAANLRGARTLCKALIGACPQGALTAVTSTTGTFDSDRPSQDGVDGPGFRVPPRSGVFLIDQADPVAGQPRSKLAGRIYGPYLSGSLLSYAKTNATGVVDSSDKAYDDTTVLLDANGNPILYYPVLNTQASTTVAGQYLSNVDVSFATSTPMYRGTDNSAWLPTARLYPLLGDKDADGVFTGNEKPAVRGKYILWSAGPDGAYGVNAAKDNKPDDVTNFDIE